MLESITIQNYALLDNVEVEFGPGFNALTGETGAGKSILLGALNLVLGARASSDAVREGASRAKIDAVFRISTPSARLAGLLQENDIELEDDGLVVSRSVSAEGRSRAYAGGAVVPLAVLARIGDELVDLHGQHEHQSLLKLERQLDLLDAYANTEEPRGKVATLVASKRRTEKQIAELESDDRERARRVEFLRFEVEEINAANFEPGEEEDLRTRHNRIVNAERIFAAASAAYNALYEADGQAAVDQVGAALQHLSELVEIDPRFKALVEQLEGVRASLDDAAAEARALHEDTEYDPQDLDAINQRLSVLSDLKRKYGESIELILAYRDQAQTEIDTFSNRDASLQALRAQLEKETADAEKAAGALSKKRGAAAKKLDKQISVGLQDLGMKGGRFVTGIEAAELSSTGADRVEFLLAANPGEQPKALRQVASGGEISRVMLALKAVFADADRIPTLIFDEIDSGVGGAVAKQVGEKLRALSSSHQTICITHIPQIAAQADTHYHVSKAARNGRTSTAVQAVEQERRVEEIARLLDGSVSEVSIEHAKALLEERKV
jgi:DNA repair protein RecN (Recombination protein N)